MRNSFGGLTHLQGQGLQAGLQASRERHCLLSESLHVLTKGIKSHSLETLEVTGPYLVQSCL